MNKIEDLKFDNTIHLISKARKSANQFLIKAMQDEGIEGLVTSHGEIIMLLIKKNEVSMGDIAQSIGKGPSTVTTLVNKLKRQGYVATKKSPECGRTTLVYMTDEGKKIEYKYKKISEELTSTYRLGIDDEEIDNFRQTLEKIYINLEKKL